ncbi:ATP-binding protein [Lachnospiraceae bacterium ZAX-1]
MRATRKRRPSFTLLFMLIFIGVVTIVTVVISVVFTLNMRGVSYHNIEDYTRERMERVKGAITGELGAYESLLKHTAVSVAAMKAQKDVPKDEMQQYLQTMKDTIPSVSYLYFSSNARWDEPGGYLVYNDGWIPEPRWDNTKRPWFVAAKKADGKIAYADPFVEEAYGKLTIAISMIVYDSLGNDIGVISEEITIDSLGEIVNSNDVKTFIVDQDGRYITHENTNMILTESIFENNDVGQYQEQILSNQRWSNVDKNLYIVSALIPNTKWALVSIVPVADIYTETNNILRIMIIIASCILIFGAVAMFIVMRNEKLRKQGLKSLEAQRKAEDSNRAKSDFLSNMSHEIRTPMNSIIGMSELALRKNTSPDVGEYLAEIRTAGTNLLSIINDILDFSKIESDKIEIAHTPYLFASLVNDVVNLINVRIAEKPILFIVNVDPTIPNCIIGDEVRVRQILTNMLSNACKYTDEGFIKMTITANLMADDKAIFKFMIEDSGKGIKEEDMEKLFDKFTRLDMGKNQNVVGTGLGLAITQSLCQMMGGDITVSSVYEKGTVFTATLQQTYEDKEKLATVENVESKWVLFYEKVKLHADSLLYALNSLDVKSTRAQTVAEFVERIAGGEYDYAFFSGDAVAPVIELVKATPLKTVPIALLEVGEMVDWGGDHIVKPIFSIQVANVLNNVIVDNCHSDTKIRFIAPSAHVLVVDDMVANLKVAEGLMSLYQMQVSTCTSGEEALKQVSENKYDIVFMDHMMPEMDGVETTAAIRKLDSAPPSKELDYFKELTIIALTANAVVGMREMFLENGFTDYLAKPIEIHKLNKILECWIPKEKCVKVEADAISTAERTLPDIYGVNIEHGIEMIGGNEENYIDVLRLFANDACLRITSMQRASLDESADLTIFTNNAHALKSAAASIGAADVSEMAKSLEFAGKNNDTETIQNTIGKFLAELEKVATGIEKAIKPVSGMESEGVFEKIDPKDLRMLKQAIQTDDSTAINDLLVRLKKMKLSAEDKQALDKIEDDVLIFEMDDATSGIDHLL